jgi:hypothetical protein
MTPGNDDARRQPGVKTTQQTDIAADSADIVAENQPIKPEIDLASWAALGGIGKLSRTERKPKRAWKRRV